MEMYVLGFLSYSSFDSKGMSWWMMDEMTSTFMWGYVCLSLISFLIVPSTSWGSELWTFLIVVNVSVESLRISASSVNSSVSSSTIRFKNSCSIDFSSKGWTYSLISEREHRSDKKEPIQFVSKSLTGSQLRWSTPEKEMYVGWALILIIFLITVILFSFPD